MTTSQRYFMTVVRERGISAAAQKLYLSQQNLSNHIQRLESEYGTLFARKPHFALTAAGEALYETLCRIAVLEQGLDDRLKELKRQPPGLLRLGIHVSRANMILPGVFAQFRRRFPKVRIELVLQETAPSAQMLAHGDLDLFLGVDATPAPDFQMIHLYHEPVYFVASQFLLEENGVDPDRALLPAAAVPKFEYLLNPPISRLRQKVDRFLSAAELSVRESMTVGDFRLQLQLSSQGEGACFCAGLLLPYAAQLNETLPPRSRLCPLRVEGFAETNDIALVIHRLAYRSEPLNGLISAFQSAFPPEAQTAL